MSPRIDHLAACRNCALFALLLTGLAPRAQAQTTALFFDSQPGDYIGGGITRTFAPPEATITATRMGSAGVTIRVQGPTFGSYWWYLHFKAAGDGPLTPGTYLNATGATFTPFVALDVSGSGRGCNRLTGRFVVLEAAYAADGTVQRFAADLEQHCEDREPALFAAVRFNSTIGSLTPFNGEYPRFELSITPSANGIVTGNGIACGAGQAACEAAYPGVNVTTLTATPNAGFIFTGWTGACSGGLVTTVNVNSVKQCEATFDHAVPTSPRTLVVWDSQPGDYIGLGKQQVFSPANSVWRVHRWGTNGVRFAIESVDGIGSSSWSLAIDSEERLAPGHYAPVMDSAFMGAPGLDIWGGSRGCGRITGRVVIHEIEFAGDGSIHRFGADLEQHCEDAGPGLFVALRYNAILTHHVQPFFGMFPQYTFSIERPVNGVVAGSGLACGGAADHCSFTSSGPTTVTVTATANPGYYFAGWTGACRGGSSTVTINVNTIKHCGASFRPITPSSPATSLVIDSQPGDFVGRGRYRVFTSDDSEWQVQTSGDRRTVQLLLEGFGAEGGMTWWRVELKAPSGEILKPGIYAPATRASFTRFAGLDVSGDSSGCNELTGRFIIHEIGFASDGTLNRLAADVEQHCEDADAALFAAIRYNSLVPGAAPFGGQYPRYELSFETPLNGRVSGAGLACGGGAALCFAEFPAPATVAVQATPDPGFMFTGWTGACHGGSAINVRVHTVKHCGATFAPIIATAPRTLLVWNSAAGDYIGQGRSDVYSSANSVWTASSRDGAQTAAFVIASIGARGESRWTVELSAQSGAMLAPGSYPDAMRYPFHGTRPGIAVWGNGRGCNRVVGSFTVHEIIVKSGQLAAFAADFEQRCESASAPPLIGKLRFNSIVPVEPAPSGGCTTPDPFVALGGGTCYLGGWLPPGMPIPGTPDPPPPPTSPAPPSPLPGGCTTPDPFVALGGGTCYLGGWLPPGMPIPGVPAPPPVSPTPPSPPPASGGCTTPDPFVALGGGTCYQGGWLPPGMPIPGAPAPPPVSPPLAPPPPASGGCTTPDPFVALGGGTCYQGGWLPPGMPIPGAPAPPPVTPTPAPAPPSSGGCTSPDPFTALGGGTCYQGGWLPPGMPIPGAPPSPPPTAAGCITSDPFVGIPGLIGRCQDGGWVPVPGVRTTGTIRFMSGANFWAIVADDGTVYSPMQALDPSFQTEGLRVTFSGEFAGSVEGEPPTQRIHVRSISTP